MVIRALICASLLFPVSAAAQEKPGKAPATPYAGLQKRAVKSLSASDIATLKTGGGWGLALAAELNGLPGPAHILELKAKLGLTADQETRVRRIFEAMRAAAIPLGERLIAQETRLDHLFATKRITPALLKETVAEIGRTRAALRTVHLAAHLETPKILTPHQIRRYAMLRGYSGSAGSGGHQGGHQGGHHQHKH